MENSTQRTDWRGQPVIHDWIESYGIVDLLKTIRDICLNKGNLDVGGVMWPDIGLAVHSALENVRTIMENAESETVPDRDSARVLQIGPDWYHTTEDEGLSVAYATEDQARTALDIYCLSLDDPQLPDSLTDAGEIAI